MDSHMVKNETGLLSYTIQKRKKKTKKTEWVKNLYVRVDIVKLLEQSSLASILLSLDSFVF